MCDTACDTTYICFKGNNPNFIQINFSSENSTGDSVLSVCENSEEKRGKTRPKICQKNSCSNTYAGKYENSLGKKTKRTKGKNKVGDAKNIIYSSCSRQSEYLYV